MPTRSGPRKYDPLTAYLTALTADEVMLTLAEIEDILGAVLPPSARRALFWANMRGAWGGSTQARAWSRVGWRVVRTDLRSMTPTVTFARMRSP